jgi:predicted RNase H-like HicB family nuclease
MKIYTLEVVIEPDEDFDGNPSGWHAYCPTLERRGASTWGSTQTKALKNINDLVPLVVKSMIDHAEALPGDPTL